MLTSEVDHALGVDLSLVLLSHCSKVGILYLGSDQVSFRVHKLILYVGGFVLLLVDLTVESSNSLEEVLLFLCEVGLLLFEVLIGR